ncbi:MAG: NAD(P)H-dependent oxidoreductase [Pseudomonadota bacterium]|nr:NAD(P)H-dependent oxidoreductase [Pseudomonadota bacterium]MEE3102052.1 NAD(P)H-dependent oxidoreductase [Pseudomonadota bacterium]
MTLRLHTVIASTRPGRVGPAVADWFHGVAAAHPDFDAHLVDLADFNLPVFDEPNHPRSGKYIHPHTLAWSESVKAADAFVFVAPEYNFHAAPSLVNALTYLSQEWAYKPAGFVSYGGASGGVRAVENAKGILSVLRMVPLLDQVMVPMVGQKVKDGAFQAEEIHETSAKAMLDELAKLGGALKPLHAG